MTVRKVLVDVVVTGHGGKPITGLPEKDFEVLDNGKRQQIRSFTQHRPTPPPEHELSEMPYLPRNTFTNFSKVPANAPLNVVLLDFGNTPWEYVPYVREQVRKFFLEQPLHARYALFVMGAGKLSMIQGFTAHKKLLLAAIDSKATRSMLFESSVNPFTVRASLAARHESSFGGVAPSGGLLPDVPQASPQGNRQGPATLRRVYSDSADNQTSMQRAMAILGMPAPLPGIQAAQVEYGNKQADRSRLLRSVQRVSPMPETFPAIVSEGELRRSPWGFPSC